MCRNIRVLYNFQPPTTREEMRAASLQYVRKVSGITKPSDVDLEAFDRAVAELTDVTERLLASLSARTQLRTRETEKEKARARWQRRETRIKEPR